MREDDNNPFRQSPGDGQERLWLRQSATFTVNGQTRTVEIALPVRPGAPPDEVEALLDEADAGMRRLARRLDVHVAEAAVAMTGAEANQPDAAVATPATSAIPRHVASSASPASPASPTPAAPRPPTSPARTIAEAPFAVPAAASPASPLSPASQTVVAGQASAGERQAATPTMRPPSSGQTPTQPTPTTTPTPTTARPTTPAAAPVQPTRRDGGVARASATDAPTPTAASATSAGPLDGPELTIAEFLVAAKTLGFNPKQAMDTLNVRSLNGLNLREALAVLQRQSLRDDATAAPTFTPTETPHPKAVDAASNGVAPRPATSPAGAPTPATDGARPAMPSAPAAPTWPAPRPAYGFDEEDEPDLTFDLPDGPPDDDFGAPYPTMTAPGPARVHAPEVAPPDPSYTYDDLDDLDELDDLDDLDDLNAPGTYAPTFPAPVEEEPGAAETGVADDGQAQARRIIARLRTARGGGVPVQQQRIAYRNIVIAQLGEQMATALVRGVWRITPDRLGPEQLDALIHWGKEDAFADEVVLALAAVEDERAAQSATPGAPTQTTVGEPTPRPAARTAARPGATPPAGAPATRPTPTRSAAPRQADDTDGAPSSTPPTRARAPRT